MERVPVSFWFHFLKDEIHSDAFQHPELTETLLAGETKYIDEADPDYVKIMTDGFFPYENETVLGLKSAADFAKIKPLPDDSPWFTRQIEYAKKIVGRNDGRAYFYNVFCAATTVKFMRGDDGETFLADAVKENPDAVKKGLDIISGDLAKLARRVIEEAGVTGIYLSLQNLQGVSRETYDAILAPGEKAILEAANAVSDYQILHICGYAGHRNDLSWYTDYPAKAINWAAVVEGVPLEEGKRLLAARRSSAALAILITKSFTRVRKKKSKRKRKGSLLQPGARASFSARTARCRGIRIGSILNGCGKPQNKFF